MSSALKRWLSSERAPWWIVALGLVLMSPALTVGFATDDHIHRVLSREAPEVSGLSSRPLDLFVFANGSPDDNHALMDEGVFPWWTAETAKLAFFRPLSSLTHALDHALWPESAALAQAHGLLWFAGSLLALWALYRRLFAEGWVAALALLLYAVDDARGPTVGWIANRNATVALTFAVLAMVMHVRARREAWRLGRFLAPLLLAASLLAGESALAITAYLFAYALHLEAGPSRARLWSLAPYVGVVVMWRSVYVALGYGVSDSGVYVDPGADPVGFVVLAARRLPVLQASQLLAPWSDVAGLYPFLGEHAWLIALSAAFALFALLGYVLRPVWRRDPLTRFFVTGTLLATLPACSTFPADRLLGFVGVGGMGLIARLLQHAWFELDPSLGRTRRLVTSATATVLALVHLVLSPPTLAVRSRSMDSVERLVERTNAALPSDARLHDKTVILVTAPGDPFVGYLLLTRASRNLPRPEALRWLATGLTEVTIERLDAHTLRVSPDGGFVQFQLDQMLRDPALAFAPGQEVSLTGMHVRVESLTPDGRPQSVIIRFARALEDPTLVWLRWQDAGLVPYAPPAVGDREVLPAIDLFGLLAAGAS